MMFFKKQIVRTPIMLINRQMWGLVLLKVKQLLGCKRILIIFSNPLIIQKRNQKSREVNWLAPCHSKSKASWSLLKLMSIKSVMPSNHLILPPLIFPNIRVFSNESVLSISWPKYWSFSISPFNGYSGLTFFRMDWLDLLAVQGTLKSLFQHHSSKTSILALSFLYCPTFTSIHDYWKNRSLY